MNHIESRTRRGERGAAIFMVVLVITLLTTIGIFAARNASQVSIASGHARQATQAIYFTEMGGQLGIEHFGNPGVASMWVGETKNSADPCMVTRHAPAGTNCKRIAPKEIRERLEQNLGSTISSLYEPQSAATPGSFGPALLEADQVADASAVNSGREGVFVVELTEGFSIEGLSGYDKEEVGALPTVVNVTAFGQVRTTPNTSISDPWCGNDVSARSATIMGVRWYVTVLALTGSQ
jgi:hypothetical protein